MSCYLPISIRGTGRAIPDKVLTNDDFVKMLDTSDEWIRTRTGIRERHIAADGQSTVDLAAAAAQQAIENARIVPDDIDMIICATITPECITPATACFVQQRLGIARIPAFDVSAACSGFVYAMITASHFIGQGEVENVLIIGAECMSRFTDYTDRSTCILFGDGAGAAVIGRAQKEDQGIHYWDLGADGRLADVIITPAGGSRLPASHQTVEDKLHTLKMNGREVYKYVVVKMQEVIEQTMAAKELTPDDIAMVIPHQSNLRIIESATQKMGFPENKVFVNIDRYGNMSGASIGVALDEVMKGGFANPDQWIILAGFGAGMTWATALVKV